MSQPKPDRRSGFTLIELLVVISIIALLISILLPALSNARKAAQQLDCATRLKQIDMSAQYYSNDYRGHVVPWVYQKSDGSTPLWGDLLTEHGAYLPDGANDFDPTSSVLLCPSSTVPKPTATHSPWSRGHYGISEHLAGRLRDPSVGVSQYTHKENEILNPSDVYFFFDAGVFRLNWYNVLNPSLDYYYLPGAEPNISRAWNADYQADALDGRHPNGAINMAYFDGHVTAILPRDVIDPLQQSPRDRKAWALD